MSGIRSAPPTWISHASHCMSVVSFINIFCFKAHQSYGAQDSPLLPNIICRKSMFPLKANKKNLHSAAMFAQACLCSLAFCLRDLMCHFYRHPIYESSILNMTHPFYYTFFYFHQNTHSGTNWISPFIVSSRCLKLLLLTQADL